MKTSRRRFLSMAWVSPFALRAHVALSEDDSNGTLIRTHSGTLRDDYADGVCVFRGVPFGEPPLGELRFRPR